MVTLSGKTWVVEQRRFAADPHLETCFTLANGYMGVRGTFEEMYTGEETGTYVAGVFDKSEAQVTELVNLPFFFGLRLYANGVRLDATECTVLDFYRALDMKQALLYKMYRLQDKNGNITKIEGYRYLSQQDRRLAGIRYEVTAENYSGSVTVESFTDGTTVNSMKRPQEKVKHYTVRKIEPLPTQGMYLEAATRDLDYRVGIASVVRVERGGENAVIGRRRRAFGEQAVESVDIELTEGQAVAVEKYVAVVHSRQVEKDRLQAEAEQALNRFTAMGIGQELEGSIRKYSLLWRGMDIEVDGDEEAEQALRFNLFHLMNCANPEDERVSIAAKGLHGEGYKGHVFWDTEIFMIPFFVYTYPQAARSMLMYRYHLLDAARTNARTGGYLGARYPWESADSGLEETPRWGFDYKGNRVRIWTGDIEYHITADVAYAIWQYYRATGDEEFFLNYGAEMFLETARFWSSRGEYNAELDRYEINEVIGPDEFHEHFDNNLYTNYLARWNLTKALEILDWLKTEHRGAHDRLVSNIGLTEQELVKWRDVAEKMYVPIGEGEPLLEQHEGYFNLIDKVITEYDENNMPVWPEGVNTVALNNYTLIKQADIIQLLHMFGEEFDLGTKKKNFEYYERRTMHKSSLSPGIYCIMGLVVGDFSKAYAYLMRTAKVDLADNQGNTAQGLHAASTGGTWQAAVNGFGGMRMEQGGGIGFAPTWLPKHWKQFSYRIQWKGQLIQAAVTQNEIRLRLVDGEGPLEVYVYGEPHVLKQDHEVRVPVQFAAR